MTLIQFEGKLTDSHRYHPGNSSFPSIQIRKQKFRAVNKNGYMVDLVKPEPKPTLKKERNLHWLASAPKFSHIVIGDDGFPAAMICPDPRAFALHKIWLSKQPEREPLKKNRDRDQGVAVAYLIHRYLPQYKFAASELKMFPKRVMDAAVEQIANIETPPDLD
jgi:hypothetical protein